ncbi:MAG: zinc-dependent metalloprotease [Coleofasciculus sp. Co-bin14]|nr:zinc-dependent metalloprotease [Coleofasciculus sp. Co-bin14]
MRKVPFWVLFFLGLLLWIGPIEIKQALPLQARQILPSQATNLQPSGVEVALLQTKAEDSSSSQFQAFDKVVKDSEKLEGLFTLYRNKQTGKVYLEVTPEQLNKNFLATVTMESGIGERGLYSGLPLQNLLFYFRRQNNNLHFVVRNVNFRTAPDDPQVRSLQRSFSDSVLYSLAIKSIHPTRKSILIDLGNLMLTDLPRLTPTLKSSLKANYQLDADKSYFGTTDVFPANVEVEAVYGFSLSEGEGPYLPTLPDNRALTLRVRYSLSQLNANKSYQPRLADERIGYFFTAYQDLSNFNRRDSFVRYINRWHLEKQNRTAALSPPKQPIVFWIENAVPVEYREAIREGVLMWNKAFEKAGFKDAIQVQQMPDNADWDPADVRYNTIRWFNSLDGFFARGPIRVNPLTGEILDTDIVVDASFVRSMQQDYRLLVEQNQSDQNSVLSNLITSGNLCQSEVGSREPSQGVSFLSQLARAHELCYSMESLRQSSIDEMGLSLLQDSLFTNDQMQKYVNQRLRWVIAHEVGHTLGLRHNFRGSTLLKPQELNDPNITQTKGLANSVMDYLPINLAPPGKPQGDYFPTFVGAYDEWAIEYGYKESNALVPVAERRFLEDIAKRSANPELAYATDEDVYDLDPNASRWDMSSDVLSYSQTQLENARAMWERLEKRYPVNGESYTELSELFDRVFWHYLQNTYFITKYIGGQSFSRNYPGDPNARLPFQPVPVTKQREALTALQKYVFASDAFKFSPQLLNKLAPSRWWDWGNDVRVDRLDYPIHDSIFFMQSRVLRDLLSSDRLTRLRDIELKSEANQALTLPELFNTLEQSIWTEVLQPKDEPQKISSIRRSLQREYLNRLASMVLRTANVPEDARTVAWSRLHELRSSITSALRRRRGEMDAYTKAHLEETRDRINKVLDAQVQAR